MGTINTNVLLGLGVFVVIATVFILLYLSSTKAKKALVEFAASRGLMVQPKDEGQELEKRVVEKLGVPEGGIYRDIVNLPLSSGEGWFFTKAPDPRTRSDEPNTGGGAPHQFIVVFMDIPVKGRTFAARAIPISGGFGQRMVEFILNRAFGAKDIRYLDVAADYPEFAKVYNVFTEDEAGARKVVLDTDVISCLMTHPRKDPVNISFTPGGFGLDIENLLKSREVIDQFVQWTDDLARVLGNK